MTTRDKASRLPRSDASPEVCVIVLFWDNPRETVKCLDSLIRQDYPKLKIVVVNNGSDPYSVKTVTDWLESNEVRQMISFEANENIASSVIFTRSEDVCASEDAAFDTPDDEVVVVSSSFNRGYAGGMNLGVTFCLQTFRPEYFILANNDTAADVCLVSELVSKIEDEPEIGAAGPTIDWTSEVSRLHPSSRVKKSTTPVDQNIPGCFFIVRAGALRAIDGFDEDFFIFFEETDMFDRLRKRGYRVAYMPTRARVEHLSSMTVSTIGDKSAFHLGRSSMLYWRKQHSLVFSKFLVSAMIDHLIRKHNIRSIQAMIKGAVNGLRH
ncbi:MAG: glycosyltransferase [Methanobacteriota archaeon]|nr:MAG: glycosyltransferase [Euryarchaeota archaeon]